MTLHRLVEEFGDKVRRCENSRDLFALVQDVSGEIGFSRTALVHGLWFRRPDRNLIRMDNYGPWAEVYVARHYYRHDPAPLAGQLTSAAFPWTEISRMLSLSEIQKDILVEARSYGLRSGFTLPVGVPGEPHGGCSFVTDRDDLPGRWRCRAAVLIGAEAFREARRLHGFAVTRKPLPHLSDRKLQCLELLTIGKTDVEIAMIEGIKESTVRTYMAALRQDFGVVSRAQLAALATRLGLVDYRDAIPQG
ncbi:MAG: hypothetical protein EOP60_00600 [Sphingomonadales bacterium]|nr:MAG: hypothetical protein EOP60_00600 [Sphingomonadales bacterium]